MGHKVFAFVWNLFVSGLHMGLALQIDIGMEDTYVYSYSIWSGLWLMYRCI